MADDAPVAQHDDFDADFEHFFQLVADEDDADAALQQRAHDAEQAFGLLRREHRGRLVEDQDVGFAVERLDDFDALLHADRQVFDQRVGVDFQPVLLRDFEDALARRAPVEQQAARHLVAQHDVLGHGQHRHQLKMLVHHADAEPDGVVGVVDLHGLSVDEDFALVRLVQAVDQVHERAFARAVFAQQAEHRAFMQF